MPGLNGPGLVPAKKYSYKDTYGGNFGGKTVTGDFDYVRDSKINHFWNDNGVRCRDEIACIILGAPQRCEFARPDRFVVPTR